MDPHKQPLAIYGSEITLYPSLVLSSNSNPDTASSSYDQYDCRLFLDSFDLPSQDTNLDIADSNEDETELSIVHGSARLNAGHMDDLPSSSDPIVPPSPEEQVEETTDRDELHDERYHAYFQRVPPLPSKPPPTTTTTTITTSQSSSSFIPIHDYSKYIPPPILQSSHFRSLLLSNSTPSIPTPTHHTLILKTLSRSLFDPQFEFQLLLKNDLRFIFLNKSDPLNWYYERMKLIEIQRLKEEKEEEEVKKEKLKETDKGLVGMLGDYGSSSEEEEKEEENEDNNSDSDNNKEEEEEEEEEEEGEITLFSIELEKKLKRLEKARALKGHFELKAMNNNNKRRREEEEEEERRIESEKKKVEEERGMGRGRGRNIPSWMSSKT
ncbi:hypothetical protein TL16_g10803 [Triparma laevis f. inornata]|uniref:Uncharacterized protein n=1 Tax=Triparma laevis f. inornata TaxID=1714386 RepID=A0A9W7BEW4_9STRA|nr:hypothetical protein TL16_g10803 [Triparma laevis f. inornata]